MPLLILVFNSVLDRMSASWLYACPVNLYICHNVTIFNFGYKWPDTPSLTILLVSSLIRQLRSFTKNGTSEADCLYLTTKFAVVMEPEHMLLRFSTLHECVHPTSWPAVLFYFLQVSGWSVGSETCSTVRFLLASLDSFWLTLEYYLRLAPTISTFNVFSNLLFAAHATSS